MAIVPILMGWSIYVWATPLALIVIWFGISLAIRISKSLIDFVLPEVLGIDDISYTGLLVRVWIKTAPMEQWRVGREFRLRVRQAFEANHIQIGKPQWINDTTNH